MADPLEFYPELVDRLRAAVPAAEQEQIDLAFNCACSFGDALLHRALPYDQFHEFLCDARLVRRHERLASGFTVPEWMVPLLFASARQMDVAQEDDVASLVADLTVDPRGFQRVLLVLAAHAVRQQRPPPMDEMGELLAALSHLVHQHVVPFTVSRRPTDVDPKHFHLRGVQKLFFIYGTPVQRVFSHFAVPVRSRYSLLSTYMLRPSHLLEFCELFSVTPRVSVVKVQEVLNALGDMDGNVSSERWPQFILTVAFYYYNDEEKDRHPTVEARLDAFFLTWGRPYKRIFVGADISQDCDFSSVPIPTIGMVAPERGSFKGSVTVTVHGRRFADHRQCAYLRLTLEPPGHEGPPRSARAKDKEKEAPSPTRSVADVTSPTRSIADITSPTRSVSDALSPARSTRRDSGWDRVKDKLVLTPRKETHTAEAQWTQIVTSKGAPPSDRKAVFVMPPGPPAPVEVMPSQVEEGKYICKLVRSMPIYVAASNDNIHWSSAVQAFTYYDEQPPVVVKGDLLELLLALFAMYCERDDDAPPAYEMGLPAWARFNSDFGVAVAVADRYCRFCRQNRPAGPRALNFAQFLAALIVPHVTEADIERTLWLKYASNKGIVTLQRAILDAAHNASGVPTPSMGDFPELQSPRHRGTVPAGPASPRGLARTLGSPRSGAAAAAPDGDGEEMPAALPPVLEQEVEEEYVALQEDRLTGFFVDPIERRRADNQTRHRPPSRVSPKEAIAIALPPTANGKYSTAFRDQDLLTQAEVFERLLYKKHMRLQSTVAANERLVAKLRERVLELTETVSRHDLNTYYYIQLCDHFRSTFGAVEACLISYRRAIAAGHAAEADQFLHRMQQIVDTCETAQRAESRHFLTVEMLVRERDAERRQVEELRSKLNSETDSHKVDVHRMVREHYQEMQRMNIAHEEVVNAAVGQAKVWEDLLKAQAPELEKARQTQFIMKEKLDLEVQVLRAEHGKLQEVQEAQFRERMAAVDERLKQQTEEHEQAMQAVLAQQETTKVRWRQLFIILSQKTHRLQRQLMLATKGVRRDSGMEADLPEDFDMDNVQDLITGSKEIIFLDAADPNAGVHLQKIRRFVDKSIGISERGQTLLKQVLADLDQPTPGELQQQIQALHTTIREQEAALDSAAVQAQALARKVTMMQALQAEMQQGLDRKDETLMQIQEQLSSALRRANGAEQDLLLMKHQLESSFEDVPHQNRSRRAPSTESSLLSPEDCATPRRIGHFHVRRVRRDLRALREGCGGLRVVVGEQLRAMAAGLRTGVEACRALVMQVAEQQQELDEKRGLEEEIQKVEVLMQQRRDEYLDLVAKGEGHTPEAYRRLFADLSESIPNITRRQRKLGFDLRYVEELVAGTDVAQLAWQERQAALRVECVSNNFRRLLIKAQLRESMEQQDPTTSMALRMALDKLERARQDLTAQRVEGLDRVLALTPAPASPRPAPPAPAAPAAGEREDTFFLTATDPPAGRPPAADGGGADPPAEGAGRAGRGFRRFSDSAALPGVQDVVRRLEDVEERLCRLADAAPWQVPAAASNLLSELQLTPILSDARRCLQAAATWDVLWQAPAGDLLATLPLSSRTATAAAEGDDGQLLDLGPWVQSLQLFLRSLATTEAAVGAALAAKAPPPSPLSSTAKRAPVAAPTTAAAAAPAIQDAIAFLDEMAAAALGLPGLTTGHARALQALLETLQERGLVSLEWAVRAGETHVVLRAGSAPSRGSLGSAPLRTFSAGGRREQDIAGLEGGRPPKKAANTQPRKSSQVAPLSKADGAKAKANRDRSAAPAAHQSAAPDPAPAGPSATPPAADDGWRWSSTIAPDPPARPRARAPVAVPTAAAPAPAPATPPASPPRALPVAPAGAGPSPRLRTASPKAHPPVPAPTPAGSVAPPAAPLPRPPDPPALVVEAAPSPPDDPPAAAPADSLSPSSRLAARAAGPRPGPAVPQPTLSPGGLKEAAGNMRQPRLLAGPDADASFSPHVLPLLSSKSTGSDGPPPLPKPTKATAAPQPPAARRPEKPKGLLLLAPTCEALRPEDPLAASPRPFLPIVADRKDRSTPEPDGLGPFWTRRPDRAPRKRSSTPLQPRPR